MNLLKHFQVLRSVSGWTFPKLGDPQDSIHKAYLYMIHHAKHYIYIEVFFSTATEGTRMRTAFFDYFQNQFFVSIIGSDDVENHICNALCERIVRAHQ